MHILCWQVCLAGLILALGVAAIACIEQSAVIIILVASAALGIGAVFRWRWQETPARNT
jgi:hypothetical protein